VLVVKGGQATDAVSGEKVDPVPEGAEDVVANNRLRKEIEGALAALKLIAPSGERAWPRRRTRQRRRRGHAAAGAEGAGEGSRSAGQVIARVDRSSMEMKSGDKQTRIAAIRRLGESNSPNSRTLLAEAVTDADEDIQVEAQKSLRAVQGKPRLGRARRVAFRGHIAGLDPAAGGARPRHHLRPDGRHQHGARRADHDRRLHHLHGPGVLPQDAFFDWYLLAAVPASFVVAGASGMLLERVVIRWLYGRPLETLLATWGISLMLIQTVRTIFGAQNVQVENPNFMSGGIQAFAGVVMPWSRIYIVVFAALVLLRCISC
jgi:urea transport system permease protein